MVLITKNEGLLPFGAELPEFSVEEARGGTIASVKLVESMAKGLVIVVTCNHCPYALAYEDRTIALAIRTKLKGISWLAINPNVANPAYPDDSFLKMQVRAREMNLPYPYAADADQAVARALGAACTPEYFLFDGNARLVYTGRLDDAQELQDAKVHYLADAIDELLNGRAIRTRQSHPIGCSIKWN